VRTGLKTPQQIARLKALLEKIFPPHRLIDDRLRCLAYGTDASLYRLVPSLVVVVVSESELIALLAAARREQFGVTFRGAGTSLSGQALGEDILVLLGEGWNKIDIAEGGKTIALGPAVRGGEANRALAPYKRRLGPDPASLDYATIAGIAANNAAGMCCGTRYNSYALLESLRLILADGTILDSADPQSRAAFRHQKAYLLQAISALAHELRADTALVQEVQRKFSIRNTMGYSLNALVDFDDPIDILTHLLIGSEGSLAFLAEIRYKTVAVAPYRGLLWGVYHDVVGAAQLSAQLAPDGRVSAIELIDYQGLKALGAHPALPQATKDIIASLVAGPGQGGEQNGQPAIDGALNPTALLVEVSCYEAEALKTTIEQIAAFMQAENYHPLTPLYKVEKAGEMAKLWALRKGLLPIVGSARTPGTTFITEDVAVPLAHLAGAVAALQRLFYQESYQDAVLFGHARDGNLHIVFSQDFSKPDEIARYERLMKGIAHNIVEKFGGSLKGEHGTGRNMAPFVAFEWGPKAYDIMWQIKNLLDPQGILNPNVVLSHDLLLHLRDFKPMPVSEPHIDRCIECGFCETSCPSHGFTFSPRQRISAWRALSQASIGLKGWGGFNWRVIAKNLIRGRGLRKILSSPPHLKPESAQGQQGGNAPKALSFGAYRRAKKTYAHAAIKSCAGCSSCTVKCPVGIDTGDLIRHLRAARQGRFSHFLSLLCLRYFYRVTLLVRLLLRGLSLAADHMGPSKLISLSAALRWVSGGRVPIWSTAWPRPAGDRVFQDPFPLSPPPTHISPQVSPSPPLTLSKSQPPLVIKEDRTKKTSALGVKAPLLEARPWLGYFTCCTSRVFGPAWQDKPQEDQITIAAGLIEAAGFSPACPKGMGGLCCGLPFASKGFMKAANLAQEHSLTALEQMLDEKTPQGILIDASPCARRLRQAALKRPNLAKHLYDSADFIETFLLPHLPAFPPLPGGLALHVPCSVRLDGALYASMERVARRLAQDVIIAPEQSCCGFAGDKGFTMPELNKFALRHLRPMLTGDMRGGISSSRSCEIGLTQESGYVYRSLFHWLALALSGAGQRKEPG
jgi:D-lactate dehydrogenase